jgi:1-phosphofructokinase family hexose kinase
MNTLKKNRRSINTVSMSKLICALTPNPALDLSGVVRELTPNEKSYVTDEKRLPGGNAINAARILHRLKIPVIASGFLGGSTGEELAALLKAEKVKTSFVDIHGSTRINVTVSNSADRQQTRLSFPGPKIRTVEKKNLFDFFSRQKNLAFLLVGGSLPQGFTAKDVRHLMALARKKGIESVIDCPGPVLADLLSAKPLLIKPNLEEFQELTGSSVKSIGQVQQKAQKMLKDVPYVCVSSVEGGTLLLTRQGTFFGRIPKLQIHSTVGAGDSMVGAMLAQLYQGCEDPAELLRWGLAASAATLAEPGTTLGTAAAIRALYRKTRVRLVN